MESNSLDETIPIEESTIKQSSDDKILNFIYYEEPQNIIQQSKETEKKYYQLKKICVDLLHKKVITTNDFEILRRLAISKGGFLSLLFRKCIWKKILSVNFEKNEYELVFIDEKKSTNIFTDPYQLEVFSVKHEKYKFLKAEDYKIIDNDVKRSKINFFPMNSILSNDNSSISSCSSEIFPVDNIPKEEVNSDQYIKDQLLFLKKKLKSFLNAMTTINNSSYKYYQGYHDIGLFFIFLFIDEFETAISVFQRFSEFFLKEYLLNFNFNNVMVILKEIISKISPQTQEIVDFYCEGNMLWSISWILSLFTHNIDNLNLQYRLFDYFLVSHPICIYHLVAHIIIDEIAKLDLSFYNSTDKFFLYFQELNMDKIDYEYYIKKTEESMKKYPVSHFFSVFKKLGINEQ